MFPSDPKFAPIAAAETANFGFGRRQTMRISFVFRQAEATGNENRTTWRCTRKDDLV
jgi:hypothetical protein